MLVVVVVGEGVGVGVVVCIGVESAIGAVSVVGGEASSFLQPAPASRIKIRHVPREKYFFILFYLSSKL